MPIAKDSNSLNSKQFNGAKVTRNLSTNTSLSHAAPLGVEVPDSSAAFLAARRASFAAFAFAFFSFSFSTFSLAAASAARCFSASSSSCFFAASSGLLAPGLTLRLLASRASFSSCFIRLMRGSTARARSTKERRRALSSFFRLARSDLFFFSVYRLSSRLELSQHGAPLGRYAVLTYHSLHSPLYPDIRNFASYRSYTRSHRSLRPAPWNHPSHQASARGASC